MIDVDHLIRSLRRNAEIARRSGVHLVNKELTELADQLCLTSRYERMLNGPVVDHREPEPAPAAKATGDR